MFPNNRISYVHVIIKIIILIFIIEEFINEFSRNENGQRGNFKNRG